MISSVNYNAPLVVRAGSGLGDSLYLQSVARAFIAQGRVVGVLSNWPDVFRPLGDWCQIQPFSRRANRLAHYVTRKHVAGTTQFQDCCITAGLTPDQDLRLDWTAVNPDWTTQLRARARKRPIIAVQLPRAPMNRLDGFGAELLPTQAALQEMVDRAAAAGAYLIQLGAGRPIYQLDRIDWDLKNTTTICDLIDIAQAIDGFLGYVSFVVPLAESLRKPLLCVWSRRGLKAPNKFVSSITPKKILEFPARSIAVVDDQLEADKEAGFGRFFEQVSASALV